VTDKKPLLVIKPGYLPPPSIARMLMDAALVWLLMDRFQATGVVMGVVWTLFGLVSAVQLIRMFLSTYVRPDEFV
jgi:hypothetical protein